MRKFITPVSMVVTQEQYDRDLKKHLADLGYIWGSGIKTDFNQYPILVTKYNNIDNYLGDWKFREREKYGRYFIDHYNPELFLALAAMSKEDYQVGEYCYDIKNYYTDIRNKIFPITRIIDNQIWGKDHSGDSYLSKENFKRAFRKATKEELIELLSTKEQQIVNMNKKYSLLQKLPTDAVGTIFEKKTPRAKNYTSTNGTVMDAQQVESNSEWFKEVSEYKRGDLVIITGFTKNGCNEQGFTKGKIYKLGGEFFKDDNPDFSVEEDDSGEANGWCEVLFRKATQEEIDALTKSSYKVGDCVIHDDKSIFRIDSIETIDSESITIIENNEEYELDLSEIRLCTTEEADTYKAEQAVRVTLEASDYTSVVEPDEYNEGEFVIAFGCKKLNIDDLKAIQRVIGIFNEKFDTQENTSLRINSERITLLSDDGTDMDGLSTEWKGDDVSAKSIDKFVQILEKKNKK